MSKECFLYNIPSIKLHYYLLQASFVVAMKPITQGQLV